MVDGRAAQSLRPGACLQTAGPAPGFKVFPLRLSKRVFRDIGEMLIWRLDLEELGPCGHSQGVPSLSFH